MKFTCNRSELLPALSLVDDIVPNSVPITAALGWVLISVIGHDTLRLVTTNLAITVVIDIECQSDSEGEFCVSATKLSELVNAFSSEQIEFELSPSALKVVSGLAKAKLPLGNTEDFPDYRHQVKGTTFYLDSGHFTDILDFARTSAAPKTHSVPILTGVNLHLENNLCTAACADGIRIMRANMSLDTDNQAADVTIPAVNVAIIVKALKDYVGSVALVAGPQQVRIASDNVFITSQLIDGKFPSYPNVEATETPITISTSRAMLLSALNVAKTTMENQLVVLSNTQDDDGDDCILIESRADRLSGSALSLCNIDGGAWNFKVGVNLKLFHEIVKSIATDNVEIGLSGAKEVIKVRPAGNTSMLAMIMPMHILEMSDDEGLTSTTPP